MRGNVIHVNFLIVCMPFPDKCWKGSSEDIPWRDHWMQAVYYLPQPRHAQQDTTLTLVSSHDEYSLWFNIQKDEGWVIHLFLRGCMYWPLVFVHLLHRCLHNCSATKELLCRPSITSLFSNAVNDDTVSTIIDTRIKMLSIYFSDW